MSQPSNPKTLYRASPDASRPAAVRRALPVLGVFLIGFAVYFGSHRLLQHSATSDDAHLSSEAQSASLPLVVTLTPEKKKAAGIEVAPVHWRELQATRTVPGTLQYDATRHLQLRSRVESVVMEVLVSTGQWVEQGQQLARLTSEQVGLARNQIKKSEADLRIAQLRHEWIARTHGNLTELLNYLKEDPPIADLEARFEGKLLGDHRDELISAYSQFMLARSMVDRTRTLGDQGVVSGRTLEERTSQREIAAAAFRAACEQSEFESHHRLEVSAAEVDVADGALDVCRERLSALLGPHGQEWLERGGSEFVLTAPIAGRVEELSLVEAARFSEGDSMAVLADVRRLWVAAQIHQRDWSSLKVATGQPLTVTVPASPDQQFTAEVRFVGSTVSPTTLALPLVAELDNADLLFHPGMFVWVSVPLTEPRSVLSVPVAAVQYQEGKPFVFVADGPETFRRVEFSPGITTPSWIEITSGLEEGSLVVTQGAFHLKSELLLEQEEG